MNIIEQFLRKVSYKFPKGYPDINNPKDWLMLEGMLKGMGIELQETALTPTELEKNNSKTKTPRIDILADKIVNDEPLELDKGGTFIVANKQEVLNQLKTWNKDKGAITLIDSEGNKITTSKLKKTKEFGGGSGSGGGDSQTKLQESAQALVNALAQQQGSVSETDLTSQKLKGALSGVEVNVSFDEIMEFISNAKPKWIITLVNTANLLVDYLGGGLQYHRGSSFVNSIYNAWNVARKKADLGQIKDDKWNPADIWAVSPKAESIEFKTDLNELNDQLTQLFYDKALVGISLKQQADPTPKLSIPVNDIKTVETLKDVKVSPNSKDAYLITSEGKEIQLRTFSTNGTSFQGEIKGKAANHGKIGGGVMKAFLKRQSIPTPSSNEIRTKAKTLPDDFVNDFINLAEKYGKFNITPEELKSKDFDWIVSKYEALSIVKGLVDAPQNETKVAISNIVNYARSTSAISSIYLKIS